MTLARGRALKRWAGAALIVGGEAWYLLLSIGSVPCGPAVVVMRPVGAGAFLRDASRRGRPGDAA